MSRYVMISFWVRSLRRPKTRDTARFEVVPCGLEATVPYGTGTAQGPKRRLSREPPAKAGL